MTELSPADPVPAQSSPTGQASARVWRYLSYVPAAVVLMWPALLNRYPLLIGDSWRYLRESRGSFDWVSSQFYSYLLFLLTPSTVWTAVVFQSLLAVFVISLFLRRTFGFAHGKAAFLIALLGITSSIAFFVSGVMTDLMFGLGLVAAATLIMADRSVLTDVVLVLIVGWAAAAHPAALPLLAVLAVLLAGVGLVRRKKEKSGLLGRAGLLGLGVLIAVVALTVNNAVVWDRPTPNPHSSVVAFAYLLGHGDLDDELVDCARWDACAAVEVGRFGLNGFNEFLFRPDGTLIAGLGGAEEFADAATEIVFEHITTDPGEYVGRVLDSARRQLVMTDVYGHVKGQMARLRPGHLEVMAAILPGDVERLAAGRQYNKELDLGWYSVLGMVFATIGGAATLVGLLLLLSRLALGWPSINRQMTRAIGAAGVLAGMYVLHAFVVGAATFPVQRYGGRVSWLLVLGFWVLVFTLFESEESGAYESRLSQTADS